MRVRVRTCSVTLNFCLGQKQLSRVWSDAEICAEAFACLHCGHNGACVFVWLCMTISSPLKDTQLKAQEAICFSPLFFSWFCRKSTEFDIPMHWPSSTTSCFCIRRVSTGLQTSCAQKRTLGCPWRDAFPALISLLTLVSVRTPKQVSLQWDCKPETKQIHFHGASHKKMSRSLFAPPNNLHKLQCLKYIYKKLKNTYFCQY